MVSIPSNLLVPGFYFTASGTSSAVDTSQNVVLLGDVTTGSPNVPRLATSVNDAITTYGANATLTQMYSKYFSRDPVSTVYMVPTAITAGVPDVADALASLGDMPVGYVVSPWADQASANAVDSWLNETTGRWAPTIQLMGVGLTALKYNANAITGILSADSANPLGTNSKYLSCLPVANSSTDSQAVIAADFAGAVIPSLQAQPNQPLSDIPLTFAAPVRTDVPSISVRNTLLQTGYSTFKLNGVGQPALEWVNTLNTQDAIGNPTNAWQDLTTVATLQYIVEAFRQVYTDYLTRCVITDNPAIAVTGSIYVTTGSVLGLYIACYKRLYAGGYVDNVSKFIQNATVTNTGNGKFALFSPITIAQGLRAVDANINFSLS